MRKIEESENIVETKAIEKVKGKTASVKKPKEIHVNDDEDCSESSDDERQGAAESSDEERQGAGESSDEETFDNNVKPKMKTTISYKLKNSNDWVETKILLLWHNQRELENTKTG